MVDEEHEDRTTVLENLADAMRKYEQGRISISRAAEETGLTDGEIEEYMVSKGYRSKYSTLDLERELELLKT